MIPTNQADPRGRTVASRSAATAARTTSRVSARPVLTRSSSVGQSAQLAAISTAFGLIEPTRSSTAGVIPSAAPTTTRRPDPIRRADASADASSAAQSRPLSIRIA